MKNPIDIHIGKKLRQIRTSLGISQDYLGELVGVSLQQIQKYEVATNRISASRLYEFAQLMEKPISVFFDGYITDKDYHNIEFRSEEDLLQIDKTRDTEISNVIKFFNQIKNFEVRSNILALLKSIAN